MIIYLGGQIIKEARGNEAVIVSRAKGKGIFQAFSYSPTKDPEEFNILTGSRTINNPLDRIYLGLSRPSANELIRVFSDKTIDQVDLKEIDSRVVIPQFIPKTESRIEVISTVNGYETWTMDSHLKSYEE